MLELKVNENEAKLIKMVLFPNMENQLNFRKVVFCSKCLAKSVKGNLLAFPHINPAL